MSFVDSLKKGLFGSEDDYDDQYMDDGPQMVNNNNGLGVAGNEEEDEPEEGAAPKRNGKVVNIHATTQLKVVLVKPEHFEDASTIADHLNNKRTVVLNLESTNKEVSRRLVDFLSGVAYANNGQIKRVANSTFIITPYNGIMDFRILSCSSPAKSQIFFKTPIMPALPPLRPYAPATSPDTAGSSSKVPRGCPHPGCGRH